jgi:hypothetical protein
LEIGKKSPETNPSMRKGFSYTRKGSFLYEERFLFYEERFLLHEERFLDIRKGFSYVKFPLIGGNV